MLRSFLNKHGNTHLGFLFNANYTEDTRDRTVYASSGKRQSLISNLYIPPDFDYSYASVKFMGEYNKPYNLNFLNMFDWNTVLQTKPQIGIGAGLIGSSSLPFHDKFFAGGDRTVRGFDSNSLGPLRNNTTCTAKTCDAIGGDFLFAIQNNWIFPPPPFLGEDNRNFRASLFVDIGNVFEDIADFSYSDLRGSYGIQGNFRTPVGAVSIGFVDAFKSKTGDDTKPSYIFSWRGILMMKKIYTYLLIIFMISPNLVQAEIKVGIVKLDVLFKEIPIYKESQNNIKNEFKPKADELKEIETSWNKLNDDYLKNERVMSKDERKNKIKSN